MNRQNKLLATVCVMVIIGAFYAVYIDSSDTDSGDTVGIAATAPTIVTDVDSTDLTADGAVGVTATSVTDSTPTQITILVPENIDAYQKAVSDYVVSGGMNPIPAWKFEKKKVAVSHTSDIVLASAEAAANQVPAKGGPAEIKLAYFKVVDSTAYVILNIDINGWAGVSTAIAQIHPIVQKTLLGFPQIQAVKFGLAPGDDIKDINTN